MVDKLEEAALSGKLFSDQAPASPPRQRSPSPAGSASRRRRSISSTNTDDELGSDLDEVAAGPSRGSAAKTTSAPPASLPQGTSGTSGNTGSKGVISDARAASAAASASRAAHVQSIREEQARKAMVGLTVHEEEEARRRDRAQGEASERETERAKWNREAAEDALARERWRAQRRAEIERERDKGREEDGVVRSKNGGIREVGREGFIRAVEREGWVLVLIYEPGIARCTALTASLLSLSLSLSALAHSPSDALSAPLPPFSLYRARARALRFSLLPPTEGVAEENDNDELGGFDGDTDGVEYDEHSGLDDVYDLEVDESGNPLGRPDPDVLPTLLAYRDGELVKTWVRVDWEVGQDGVEGLLRREGILPKDTAHTQRGADDE